MLVLGSILDFVPSIKLGLFFFLIKNLQKDCIKIPKKKIVKNDLYLLNWDIFRTTCKTLFNEVEKKLKNK